MGGGAAAGAAGAGAVAVTTGAGSATGTGTGQWLQPLSSSTPASVHGLQTRQRHGGAGCTGRAGKQHGGQGGSIDEGMGQFDAETGARLAGQEACLASVRGRGLGHDGQADAGA